MRAPNKRILWIAAGLIVIVALALPKIKFGSSKAGGPQNAAQGKTPEGKAGQGPGGSGNFKVPVSAHVVQPRKIEEKVVSTGTLIAGEELQLKSEAAGKIIRLPLQEGTRVPKGRLLVKINDADLQAQLIKARAAYNVAKVNAARQGKLMAEKFISEQDLEQANQAVESARGDVGLLQAQIAKTEIRAPFDGVVGLKLVSEGGYLTTGQPVANYVSTSALKLDFSVPEQYFDSVSPGKRVTFTIQGSSGVHTARVVAVDPKVDEATRTVSVRAICDGSDSTLAPGAYAQLELVVKENPNALTVPSQALVPGKDSQQVYVVRKGAATAQTVRTGLRTATDVEIIDGVKQGDTVISSGVLMIHPGVPVEIKSVN